MHSGLLNGGAQARETSPVRSLLGSGNKEVAPGGIAVIGISSGARANLNRESLTSTRALMVEVIYDHN